MVDSLLKKIDKYQNDIELDTLDRLEEENQMLRQSICSCRRTWVFTRDLLHEAFDAMILLEVSLSNYEEAAREAKSQWILSSQFKILGSTRKRSETH